eukprot:TRINITY_DN46808_c0_g1_i1.p1 TRINITY_DN46808_c0_g1~~TRINITY_DN46808_c0_g1_i1.p1  ORF type:complete len:689 (-),score=179.65 TRINITY_DN46808_c0_g1_i1:85-2151(-)
MGASAPSKHAISTGSRLALRQQRLWPSPCLRSSFSSSRVGIGVGAASSSSRPLASEVITVEQPSLEAIFLELRQLRPPCDAARLEALASAASQRQEELSGRQVALLLHRLGDVGWHSKQVCEVFAGRVAACVEALSPPEWIAILSYYTGAGYYVKPLCDACSNWSARRCRELHLRHLETAITSLAYFGHLQDAAVGGDLAAQEAGGSSSSSSSRTAAEENKRLLRDVFADALEPLPESTNWASLLQMAAALAVAGLERPAFFQKVLTHCTGPARSHLGPLGMAGAARQLEQRQQPESVRRAQLLILLAKAEASRPKVVLTLVRGIEAQMVPAVVPPPALLAPLVRQLHRSALRQEALLLDAAPLVAAMAKAVGEASVLGRLPFADLPCLASGLGFFAIRAPEVAEKLWTAAAAVDDGKTWADLRLPPSAAEPLSADTGMRRKFARILWGLYAMSLRRAASVAEDGKGPSNKELHQFLGASSPEAKGLRRVAQQLRQVALLVRGPADEGGRRTGSTAAGPSWEDWLHAGPKRQIFFSRRRRIQERLIETFQSHLRSRGAEVEAPKEAGVMANDAAESSGSLDVLVIRPPPRKDASKEEDSVKGRAPSEGEVAKVALWVKHPLLLEISREDPEAASIHGSAEDGVCLNGFELLERQFGDVANVRLLFLRSDLLQHQVEERADELLAEISQ